MNKLTTLVIASVFLVSASALADGDKTCCPKDGKKGFSPEKKVERMKEKLSLTDEQAAQITSILESKKQKMEALKAETQAQVEAVLTPEQKEKHEAMKKESKEKHEGHKDHEHEKEASEEEAS